MKELYSDFHDIEFPRNPNIVYIIYIVKDGDEIPIYVGESSRNIGRFGDYVSAKFSASTDFKIGEAIKYIRTFDYSVRIKYKETLDRDRKNKEREILSNFSGRYHLLNDLSGYDYLNADELDERLKIHEFVRKKILSMDTRPNDVEDSDIQNSLLPERSNIDLESRLINDAGDVGEIIRARVRNIGGQGPERLELQIPRKIDQWLPQKKHQEVEITIDDKRYTVKLSHGESKGAIWYCRTSWYCEGEEIKQTKALRMHGLKQGDSLKLRVITLGRRFEVVRI
ncbi:hypothetical protein ACFLYZ_02385 [Thermodesulfobacteriota bacterium]